MTNVLRIRNLKKVYNNGFEALKGIDLTVEKGDFFALLGPNGAGKSTTIGIISSLVNKTSGSVEVNGYDIDKNLYEAKRQIGIVPQEFNFNPFEKVRDIVMNQAGYYGISAKKAQPLCDEYLKALGLWDKRDAVARELSGGMKRRLMIVRALVHEPKLLILDEPTAGVDIELRRSLWVFLEKINKNGVTVILTTHYLEEAEQMCHNVAIINHGQIVENTSMRELLSQRDKEIFILDIQNAVKELPVLDGYRLAQVDAHTLEVEVSHEKSMNDLFAQLNIYGLHVTSMRNKANRLEELFLGMTNSL